MNLYEENIKQLIEISNFLQLTQPASINKKYQCSINDAISAFKKLEDMEAPLSDDDDVNIGNVFILTPFKNVSCETLEKIANYKCPIWKGCDGCNYNTHFCCISNLAAQYLATKKTRRRINL